MKKQYTGPWRIGAASRSCGCAGTRWKLFSPHIVPESRGIEIGIRMTRDGVIVIRQRSIFGAYERGSAMSCSIAQCIWKELEAWNSLCKSCAGTRSSCQENVTRTEKLMRFIGFI